MGARPTTSVGERTVAHLTALQPSILRILTGIAIMRVLRGISPDCRGGRTYTELINQYRDSLLQIPLMIINDLSDLFMGLW